jgi:hypothetical protein
MKIRLIIAGGRDFTDYELLKAVVNKVFYYLEDMEGSEIVSGTQRGADKLGERYAKEYGIKIIPFYPDWDKYGLAAGPIRNEEMAKYATHCIVFWDGKSDGSQDMIKKAKKHKIPTQIVKYNPCNE